MVASSGNAVRYAVIESTDPLGATAISRVRALRRDLPAMARSAGLTGVRFEVGGETAISADAIDAVLADLWRVALAIALVTVLLLAVFLRALLAPLYLLAASVLALFAAFGLTAWLFQGILGYDGLVYYVPVAVAVLLVSLGSDYNVFVVGRIWDEARRRPLRGRRGRRGSPGLGRHQHGGPGPGRELRPARAGAARPVPGDRGGHGPRHRHRHVRRPVAARARARRAGRPRRAVAGPAGLTPRVPPRPSRSRASATPGRASPAAALARFSYSPADERGRRAAEWQAPAAVARSPAPP